MMLPVQQDFVHLLQEGITQGTLIDTPEELTLESSVTTGSLKFFWKGKPPRRQSYGERRASAGPPPERAYIRFFSQEGEEIGELSVSRHGVAFETLDQKRFEFKRILDAGLLKPHTWHWLSIDATNHRLKFGVGHLMNLNSVFHTKLDIKYLDLLKTCHKIVFDGKEMEQMALHPPVFLDPPHSLVADEDSTLEILDKTPIHPFEVSPCLEKLFHKIAGPKVCLTNEDVEAIQYSLDTHGKLLFNILNAKKKAADFGDPLITSIRCSFGPDEGDGPSFSTVMEIWPPSHLSPVTEYTDQNSVTKVLAGAISVQIYHPLIHHDTRPLSQELFPTGTLFWSIPECYGVYQLLNTSDLPAVTLRTFKSDQDNTDSFNWSNDAGEIHRSTPAPDLRFRDMIQHVRDEWKDSKK